MPYIGGIWYNDADELIATILGSSTQPPGWMFNDENTVFVDTADKTKAFDFELSGITTGTKRTFTIPDHSGILAVLDQEQTFTKKQTFARASGDGPSVVFNISPDLTTGFFVDGSPYFGVDGSGELSAITLGLWPEGLGVNYKGSFSVSGLTADRSWGFPNASGTVALTSTSQTFTNKTLSTGTTFSADFTLNSGVDMILNTTTGTKIGTGTTQKLGFWNATPVVQDTGWGSITNVTTDRAYDANATTVDELADVLGTLINTLVTYGILGA